MVLATGFFNQFGIIDGCRTEDNTFDAGFKQLLYCFQSADAPTQLCGYQYGAGYLGNEVQVTGFAAGGAIKVNDMDSGCPQRLPFQSYLQRVVREPGFAVVIALIQSDAPAISNIYGRDYFYCSVTSQINIGELSPGPGIECLVVLILVFKNIEGSIYHFSGVTGHNDVIHIAPFGGDIRILVKLAEFFNPFGTCLFGVLRFPYFPGEDDAGGSISADDGDTGRRPGKNEVSADGFIKHAVMGTGVRFADHD